MLITMLGNHRGSADGFHVLTYKKGFQYNLPHSLATSFLNNGWAYNSEPFDNCYGEHFVEALNQNTKGAL